MDSGSHGDSSVTHGLAQRVPSARFTDAELIVEFCTVALAATLFWLPAASPLAPFDSAPSPDARVAPWSARRGAGAGVLGGKIVVVGGEGAAVYNDVWSYDGAAWTKSGGSSFPPRTGFALTTLPDRLLLTGGVSGTTLLNDVWSYDGSRWFQLTSAAPFPPRQMHCAVTLGNSLFVFAGYDSALGMEYRDVWRWDSNGGSASSPGTWQAVLPDPEWMPRFGASAAGFNGSIFMIGGADTNDRAFNDVWRFDGSTWDGTLLSAAFTPRSHFSMLSWSPDGQGSQQQLLVFGGKLATGVEVSEVWAYDGSWGQMSARTQQAGLWAPRSRLNVLLNPFVDGASDAGESVLLLGGGADPSSQFNDLWLLKHLNAPSPPLAVHAQALQSPALDQPSASVRVSWIPGANDGGATVYEFLVRNDFDAHVQNLTGAFPVSVAQTTAVAEAATAGSEAEGGRLSVLVDGLTYPANYSFTVEAVNVAGSSVASEPSNIVRTAEPGQLVNNGGPAAPPSVANGVGAGGSGAVTTRLYFIVPMVLVSVCLFVLLCFLLVRRHLRRAQEDLTKLEEIEALGNDEGEGEHEHRGDQEEKEAHAVDIAKAAAAAAGGTEEFGLVSPDGSVSAAAMAQQASLALASMGITGIGRGRRNREEEMEKWRRGELPARFGGISSNGRFASLQAASVMMPLGFAAGSAEEGEAIERLGAELDRLNRATLQAGGAGIAGTAHGIASSSSDVSPRAACTAAAGLLCDRLAAEFSRRFQTASADDVAFVERMGDYSQVHTVLEHALYSSGVLRHLGPSAASVQRAVLERDLHHHLFAALLPHVSTDAMETAAMVHALESDGGGGGGDDGGNKHLFLLAHACILQWMFEQVQRKRDEQESTRPSAAAATIHKNRRLTPALPGSLVAPSPPPFHPPQRINKHARKVSPSAVMDQAQPFERVQF